MGGELPLSCAEPGVAQCSVGMWSPSGSGACCCGGPCSAHCSRPGGRWRRRRSPKRCARAGRRLARRSPRGRAEWSPISWPIRCAPARYSRRVRAPSPSRPTAWAARPANAVCAGGATWNCCGPIWPLRRPALSGSGHLFRTRRLGRAWRPKEV